MTLNKDQENAINNLLWSCKISSLYNQHREGFLIFCYRGILSIIIVSSSILATRIINNMTFITFLTILPATLAALDLVLQFSSNSQRHKFLRFQFLELQSNLEAQLASNRWNKSEFAKAQAKFNSICAEEPPTYWALLYHCTNLIDIRTIGYKRLKGLTLGQYVFMNIRKYNGSFPQLIKEELENNTKDKKKKR